MTNRADRAISGLPDEFSSEALYRVLHDWIRPDRGSRFLVAFSGGMDSTALLHACAELRERFTLPLAALHADHGLQTESERWREHCVARCRALQIECITTRLHIPDPTPSGIEAYARAARYAWFAKSMGDGDIVMTAHHADDQAETVLLQLLRGAGPRGLAAMPGAKPLGPGTLLRPLLAWPRADLGAYVSRHGLPWIEDPANRDTGYDRNYLRRRVIPVIRDHWPGAAGAISRSARHCAAAEPLLEDLARLDLARCRAPTHGPRFPGTRALTLPALRELTDGRVANALRVWIRDFGARPPSTRKLQEAIRQFIRVPGDGGLVRWADGELRRYRDALYLRAVDAWRPGSTDLLWDTERPLALPALGIRLALRAAPAGGISPQVLHNARLTVRWRRGGERIRPAGCANHRELKNIYQERRVPPWERERIPLIYRGEELLAVPGIAVCEAFAAAPGQIGVEVVMEALPSASIESRHTLW